MTTATCVGNSLPTPEQTAALDALRTELFKPLCERLAQELRSMQSKVTIMIEVHDLGDLPRVEQAMRFLTGAGNLYGGEDSTPSLPTEGDDAVGGRTTRTRKPKKAKEEPAEPAQEEVSLATVKAAVSMLIEADKLEVVRSAFAACDAKKLSDVKPKDYAKLLALLGLEE